MDKMPEIITIKAHPLKLEGPGFVAERNVARMTRRNWLKWRKTGMGGTDSAAELFPNDWSGPLTVYFDKLSPVAEDEDEINWVLDFGNFMEDPMRNSIIPTYLVRKGISADKFRVYSSPMGYRSTELPWLICNVDGFIRFLEDVTIDGVLIQAGLYILELKTAIFSKKDEWVDGSTPDRYYAQGQHYTLGMKLPGVIIFVMIGNMPELRYLPAHPEFHALIEKTGTEAWRQSQERDPPSAFGGDSDLALVRQLYPVGGETAKQFDGLEVQAAEYLDAKAREKAAKRDVKRIRAWAESEIGDASGLVDGDTGVKWTRGINKAGKPINRLTVRLKGKEEEEE